MSTASSTHQWKLDQAEEAYRLFDTQTTGKGVFSDVTPSPSQPCGSGPSLSRGAGEGLYRTGKAFLAPSPAMRERVPSVSEAG